MDFNYTKLFFCKSKENSISAKHIWVSIPQISLNSVSFKTICIFLIQSKGMI